MNPKELLFAETHEWVRLQTEGNQKVAIVGITAFAVEQLTDIVFLQLPEAGQTVSAGQEFGEVESVKAVSPLYSPVDGEIVAVHSDLRDKLELLGQDPYGEGWMIRVRLSDEAALSRLMKHDAYEKQCAEEG